MFLSTKFLVNLTGNYWAMFIPDIILIAFLIQMTYGIANKHTVNDNTSGVATLLWIMEDLPETDRDKVCFDQEEVGLIGSDNFKKKYKKIVKHKLLKRNMGRWSISL
ncbi:M28 family peptidase [Miniphocaeibacter halophilus]|uniref:M28 family peptidase n=1 Tax=Miniphocaeibacter halophilus TaxID=2931922 RepID=A0AC61MPK8_9FIRM|nr:M28 family peptidase [Miniphocaeibacter halophilus]QQK07461.1 M28 family peptidase [Miniphocaeibacter halophilus]